MNVLIRSSNSLWLKFWGKELLTLRTLGCKWNTELRFPEGLQSGYSYISGSDHIECCQKQLWCYHFLGPLPEARVVQNHLNKVYQKKLVIKGAKDPVEPISLMELFVYAKIEEFPEGKTQKKFCLAFKWILVSLNNRNTPDSVCVHDVNYICIPIGVWFYNSRRRCWNSEWNAWWETCFLGPKPYHANEGLSSFLCQWSVSHTT